MVRKAKHAVRNKSRSAAAHEEPPKLCGGRYHPARNLRPGLGDLGGDGFVEVVVAVEDDALLLFSGGTAAIFLIVIGKGIEVEQGLARRRREACVDSPRHNVAAHDPCP